jgi:hypothetical protein
MMTETTGPIEWEVAYQEAFFQYAVSRNWNGEDAALMAQDTVGDAREEYWHKGISPRDAAEIDVREWELEAANADS